MKTLFTTTGVALLFALGGCASSEAADPYALEADEIDAIASALEDDATGAVDDVADDEGLASSDADGGDGRPDGAGRGHGPRRGDHRGRGVGPRDLVLWYGDLTALQACRDEREACLASGATTCGESARECVRAVLEAAFTAMCDERVAACEADGTATASCDRITARCAAGLPSGRDGGGHEHGDGGWSRDPRGPRGGHSHGDGGDCDDDVDEAPVDEAPGDAATP